MSALTRIVDFFRRRPLLWASLVLLAAILAMYQYFLTPPYYPKIFGTFDYCRYFGPQAYFLDSAIHHGEFPLWNPLAFCGMPYAASPQQTAFYPPHLVRSLLTFHPTPYKTHVGLALLMVFHMVVAGVGTMALARDYGLSRSARYVAAFAYIFGPHFVRRVMEQWILVAVAAWLPLLLFLFRRAMRAQTMQGRLYYGAGAGLVFGISTLGGFPQLTFYTAATLGLFFVIDSILSGRSKPDDSESSGRPFLRRFLGNGMVLCGIFALGALVSASMLLPASEFIKASARVKSNGLEVNAAPQDLSAKHLLQSMVAYPGATFAEQGCRAAGIGVLVLAFAAAFHQRRRDTLLYAALFLILTDMTLGPPFPCGWIMNKLDVFQFSSPWRAGILAGFPLAMLAGFGVDASARELHAPSRALRTILLLVVGIGAIVMLGLWFNRDLPVLLSKRAYFPVTSAVLYIPAFTLLLLVCMGWSRALRHGLILVPALVFVELLVWNFSYFPSFIAWSGYKGKPEAVAGADNLCQSNFRRTDPEPNNLFYTLQPAMNGYDPVCISRARQLLCAPAREKQYFRNMKDWEVTAENQRGNLFLKRTFWLARQYVNGPLPPKDALFPPTTTVFLTDAENLPVPRVEPDVVPPHAVSELTDKLPLADAVHLAKEVAPDARGFRCRLPNIPGRDTHAALYIRYAATAPVDFGMTFRDGQSGRSEFGKRYPATVGNDNVLEYALPDFVRIEGALNWNSHNPAAVRLIEAWVLYDRQDEGASIAIVSRGANSVDLQLKNLTGYRLLGFTDLNFPGWTARLDGNPVPIYTANDIFKAIVIPPDTHTVRFEFKSWRVTAGAAISLMTTAVIAAGMILFRKGRLSAFPGRTRLRENVA